MTAPRPTVEVAWGDLVAHPDVSEHCALAAPVGLMAFHAGIEAATGEIAAMAAAASGASLYVCDQPSDLRWHVASIGVDPSASEPLARFLGHVRLAIALHGYGRRGRGDPVLVVGRARPAAGVVAAHLRQHLQEVPDPHDHLGGGEVVDDLDAIPRALRGVHPANPVNRPPEGGVQVELPVGVRFRAAEAVAAGLAAAVGALAGLAELDGA